MKVMGGVKEVTREGAKFVDGREEIFDSIILATGYKSNVPSWLKVFFSSIILFFSFFSPFFRGLLGYNSINEVGLKFICAVHD